MAKHIDSLKNRVEKLKAKREEYTTRHLEKCKPIDDEITQLLRMIEIAEPKEPRQPDQIGE
jgi:hypothetical protein